MANKLGERQRQRRDVNNAENKPRLLLVQGQEQEHACDAANPGGWCVLAYQLQVAPTAGAARADASCLPPDGLASAPTSRRVAQILRSVSI
jgi:hypothetical protein